MWAMSASDHRKVLRRSGGNGTRPAMLRAVALLDAHWPTVKLAEALMVRKRLGPGAFRVLVSGTPHEVRG